MTVDELPDMSLFLSKWGEYCPVQGVVDIIYLKCLAQGLTLRDLAITMIVNNLSIECWLCAWDSVR